MKIECPDCGKAIIVNGIGRKPLGIPFKNIRESLRVCRSVDSAAAELGCSVGYIYQELGKKGLKPADVLERK